MNIITRFSGGKFSEISTSRPVTVILSDGSRFELSEDIEKYLTINKVDTAGKGGSRLNINPRYSNEIVIY